MTKGADVLMERHALLFRVKPGSEQAVAAILAGYERPATTIDEHTRLLGTTVFMHGTVVVRVMEIEGELRRVVAHLSRDPAIQATEAALNPHLVEARDLSDPMAARAFFQRAMMKRLTEQDPDAAGLAGPRRALISGLPLASPEAVDELFARDGVTAARPDGAALRCATVFRHGHTLVTVYGGGTDPEPLPGEQQMSVVTDRRALEAA
jgi:SchA/CurD like domain